MHSDDTSICTAVLAERGKQRQIESAALDEPNSSDLCTRPTRRETLAAAATLGQYLEEEPELYGSELEMLLSKLRRRLRLEQTHALTNQPITHFFSRKSILGVPNT